MTDSDPDLPEQDAGPSAAELEAAGQNALFGDAPALAERPAAVAAPSPAPAPAQPYRVLARKYRPQTFSELIGQEAMVRTLANAIARDRLAHAFLMTGVRGVGKTSTARLIAKALNCVGPDGTGGPTIDPCGVCEPCRAIAEGRHIDVIEMDAASNTGVDDVREIIEQVRYAAVSARYKIYIIDEVHMLSRNAFNALLKTLEEPPPHVKFLFATTEVDKLPVTVLSRTQRFDLRRIPAELLADHFAKVCAAEGVEADTEALRMVASAAEGSVRDGLSILDQAIAHADLDGEGRVTAARLGEMLGLADKSAQRRLLGHLLAGDAKALLAAIDEQYALGVEPLALMRALMNLVHKITLAQVAGGEPDAPSEEERAALADFAARLKPAETHRLWQLLLKGHEEVRTGPDPLVSLQMALLRVLHAGQMPDPGALMRRIEELAKGGGVPATAPAASDAGEGVSDGVALAAAGTVPDWAALVEAVDAAGQMRAAQIMRDRVRVIELGAQRLVYQAADNFPEDPAPDIRDALFKLTGKRWLIERGSGEAQPSLREAAEAERAHAMSASAPIRWCRLRWPLSPMLKFLVRKALLLLAATLADDGEPPMKSMEEMMKAAQAAAETIQKQMNEMQVKLDSIEVEGTAGGGLVKVRASAKGRILGVHIDDSLMVPDDKQMLEDLVAAAFNDARDRADRVSEQQMREMQGSMGLPPGFNLPGLG